MKRWPERMQEEDYEAVLEGYSGATVWSMI